MTRPAALLMAGALLLAAAGCGGGGGGGDEDAFCDTLEALSDDIADGGLGSARGLEDAVDRANDLREVAAEGEQADAVTDLGELLSDSDTQPEDEADTAEEVQDAIGDIAEDDCEIDDFAAVEVDVDDTTTTTGADDTTTTTDPDDTTVTTGAGGDGELNVVGVAIDPATAGVEPGFEANIDLCFRGLMVACDDIFFGENGQAAAPEGSVARGYAGSCAGRIEFNNETVRCDENIFAAVDFDAAGFTDPSFEALAQGCFDGDMASCDTLFQQTGVGTPEEAYGDTCGGRIDPDVADRETGATCVGILGPTAEFG